jgi:hypothetical protein
MQGPAQGQSTAIGEEGQRSGQPVRRKARPRGGPAPSSKKSIPPASPAQCKARPRGGPAPSRRRSVALPSRRNAGPGPGAARRPSKPSQSVVPASLAPCKAPPRSGPGDQSGPPHCLRIRRPDFMRSSRVRMFNVSTTPISRFRSTRMPNTVTLYDVPATIVDILPNIAASSTLSSGTSW